MFTAYHAGLTIDPVALTRLDRPSSASSRRCAPRLPPKSGGCPKIRRAAAATCSLLAAGEVTRGAKNAGAGTRVWRVSRQEGARPSGGALLLLHEATANSTRDTRGRRRASSRVRRVCSPSGRNWEVARERSHRLPLRWHRPSGARRASGEELFLVLTPLPVPRAQAVRVVGYE